MLEDCKLKTSNCHLSRIIQTKWSKNTMLHHSIPQPTRKPMSNHRYSVPCIELCSFLVPVKNSDELTNRDTRKNATQVSGRERRLHKRSEQKKWNMSTVFEHEEARSTITIAHATGRPRTLCTGWKKTAEAWMYARLPDKKRSFETREEL